MRTLTGSELERARDALVSGYYSWHELSSLVLVVLNIPLRKKIGGEGVALDELADRLLSWTERRGLTEMFLREAQARNPGNPLLKDLAVQLGLSPAPMRGRDARFEAQVVQSSGLGTPAAWRQRMVEAERRVVQILRQEVPIGTGVLV